MSFFNKLNDTYELLNKLDDIINKNTDNGLLKKQLLCLSENLSRYKDIDVKNIKFEKENVESKITYLLNRINDIEIDVKNKLTLTEKYNSYLNS
tara:strand:- start:123 stop:404 length:282 start_codon:yes stop_codon:yes gene_type:complete